MKYIENEWLNAVLNYLNFCLSPKSALLADIAMSVSTEPGDDLPSYGIDDELRSLAVACGDTAANILESPWFGSNHWTWNEAQQRLQAAVDAARIARYIANGYKGKPPTRCLDVIRALAIRAELFAQEAKGRLADSECDDESRATAQLLSERAAVLENAVRELEAESGVELVA